MTVPLFPLSHVLLPGMPLPLHIFEERYRTLVRDLEAAPDGAAFGVVALRSGTEAASVLVTQSGGTDVADVVDIGTVAEVLDIEANTDGSSDLLAVGSRRFRIRALVPIGKPYLRAEVDYLDERDGDLSTELPQRVRELLEVYDGILVRLAGRATGEELPQDASQLSYQVAARLPLPPAERQALLGDDTTADRLHRVTRLLRRELALLQATRSIAVSPAVVRLPAAAN